MANGLAMAYQPGYPTQKPIWMISQAQAGSEVKGLRGKVLQN
jgi:hypothetical protein